MTERYEVTSELQRELVRDREIFGDPVSVKARSVHNVMKAVAGAPLRRPAWFFDIAEYGEGPGRRGHARGRSGAVDAVPGSADRLAQGRAA